MLNVILHGASGAMGHALAEAIAARNDIHVVCGVDPRGGQAAFPIYQSLAQCPQANVVIDFSTASAVPALVDYCVAKKLPLVVCTTALSPETLAAIDDAAAHIPVFRSANMSLGINLLISLLKKAAPVLADAGFDIEIVERHHNQKIDAPSGTALMLADAINGALDEKYHYVYDRSQTHEKRTPTEIGIHSLRGGNIAGDHEVVFAGQNEIVSLSHHAGSKAVFANGAIQAALFLAKQAPGLYDMSCLLG